MGVALPPPKDTKTVENVNNDLENALKRKE